MGVSKRILFEFAFIRDVQMLMSQEQMLALAWRMCPLWYWEAERLSVVRSLARRLTSADFFRWNIEHPVEILKPLLKRLRCSILKKFKPPDTMLVSTDVQKRFCGFLMAKAWIVEELTGLFLLNPASQQALVYVCMCVRVDTHVPNFLGVTACVFCQMSASQP